MTIWSCLWPNGAEISAEVSQSRARVNDVDAVHIGEHDLEASGVAAELLKTGIADWDGSARTVKLKPHRNPFCKGNSAPREPQRDKSRQGVGRSIFVQP